MTAPSARPTRLHIGVDAEKVVVSRYRLRMRTGRGTRTRRGSMVELVPAPASGRSRDARIGHLFLLALALVLLCGVLGGAGLPWWAGPSVGVLVLGVVAREQARAAAVGTIALPRVPADDPAVQVLTAPDERLAFERSFAVAKRIQRSWPALRHLIDPAEAEPMLRLALGDLAAVLLRRQQMRTLRRDLAQVHHDGLPADSPAVQSLLAQRHRLEVLWRESGEEANRHILSIHAAAKAGEDLIREQRIGATARQAGQ
ncbi:MAG TPA: hypothetical protein VFO77_04655, partial [Actinoplanes sp.]|nr:hypothetical protein [Actinoplanes sp.]